ncbi:hypothetical protein LTR81_004053 [Elasticomyces elasticus]
MSKALVDRTRGQGQGTNPPPATRKKSSKPLVPAGPNRFITLPAELRIKIYELILFPSALTVVFRRKLNDKNGRKGNSSQWRFASEPQPSAVSRVRYCEDLPMSRYTREGRALPKGHPFTLSAMLFVNKQIYKEATAVLYEQCNFFFDRFEVARSFLRIVSKPNLDTIRSLTIQHVTQNSGRSAKAIEGKNGADLGFLRMCRQFVADLPSVRKLRVAVEVMEHPSHIVPDFSDQGSSTFTVEQYKDRKWLQTLEVFKGMKDLIDVNIEFKMMPDEDMECWFMCDRDVQDILGYAPGGPERDRIMALWLGWFKSLHRSMGEVVRRIVLRQSETDAWKDHVVNLEEYRAFCMDPLEPVAQTLASDEYQKYKLLWDTENAKKKPVEVVAARRTIPGCWALCEDLGVCFMNGGVRRPAAPIAWWLKDFEVESQVHSDGYARF